jgi:hypothetical protein
MDAIMMWILVFALYQAPADAVDWDGPWTFGKTFTSEKQFQSEAECRSAAVKTIGRIHQGMLAPIRYRCINMQASLGKGAPR